MHLCIEFQENYKRLDRLCKDYFSSIDGVSEYIRQMEATPWRERRLVLFWERDYKMLKHLRWVRNQLAHEVGAFEAGVCTVEDLRCVKEFHERMLKREDPFGVIRKEQERQRLLQQEERQRALREQKERERIQELKRAEALREKQGKACEQNASPDSKKDKSFFEKLLARIKKWWDS